MSLLARVRTIVSDLGGARRTASLTLSDPMRTLRSGVRLMSRSYLDGICSKGRGRQYEDELASSGLLEALTERLARRFEAPQTLSGGGSAVPGGMRQPHLLALFALTRALQPDRVIETGVCNGLSTAVILSALEHNGCGLLSSVDLPEIVGEERPPGLWRGKGGAAVPPGETPGWLVPEALRHRWQLHLGRSQDLLPGLIGSRPLDLFVSDGEHSFEGQLFEYRLAWSALRSGGVMYLTDINQSDAFRTVKRDSFRGRASTRYVDHSAAVVRKPG